MRLYVLNIFPPHEQFSYSVVCWGILPSALAQVLYLTRENNRRTVPSGEDNNRIIMAVTVNLPRKSVTLKISNLLRKYK